MRNFEELLPLFQGVDSGDAQRDSWGVNVIRKTQNHSGQCTKRRGSIFVEYLLLATIVGIGAIAGVATVRTALDKELHDLANAIGAIISPVDDYTP